MMSSNNLENNPKSILQTNIMRWNHDLKHFNKIKKFRCRYNKIEVKCIFKPNKFNDIFDHHPIKNSNTIKVINSINLKNEDLNPFYDNLRENDINNGFLLCYHYRIISKENNLNKLKNNLWYINNKYTIDDLMSSDHNEIIDKTLKNKSIIIYQ